MGTKTYEAKGNRHLDVEQVELLPYHKEVGKLALKHASNGSVLDIGSGMGQLELFLSQNGFKGEVHVADAYDVCIEASSDYDIVKGHYKLSETEFNPHLAIDRKFDVVVMSHVLEHIHNPSRALENVLSLLNEDGVLIVAVPNPSRPLVFFGNIFKFHYANRGHVQAWDPSHWRIFLEQAMKLNVLEYASDFIDFPKHRKLPLLQKLGVLLAKPFPWWSFSNIAAIQARKAGDERIGLL